MSTFRMFRLILGLGWLGLLLSVATASAQPTTQLIDRIFKEVQSRPKVEPKSDDPPLRRLLIERCNVAREEVLQRCEDFKKGLSSRDKVVEAARDQLTAEMEMLTGPEEKVKALERIIELIRWYEGELERALKDGVGLRADILRARHSRLNYEIEILRLKQGMSGPTR